MEQGCFLVAKLGCQTDLATINKIMSTLGPRLKAVVDRSIFSVSIDVLVQ